MLGSILFSILLLLILRLAYNVIKAYRFKSFYAAQARNAGYHVHEHPFCWFGSAMYTEFKKQQEENNDAHFHYKNHLSKYDLIVSNLLLRTMVEIQNPNLIRQFFLKANEGYYIKGDFGLGHLQRLIGTENLLLSEGDYWKNRRKILSNVFNFDFIINQIPKIQSISKNVLSRLCDSQHNHSQIKCDISEPLLAVFSGVILKCFFKGQQINFIGKQRTVDFMNRMLVQISNVGRSKMGVFMGIKFAKMGLTKKNRRINQEIQQFRKAARSIVEKRINEIEQTYKSAKANNKNPQDIIEALIHSNQMKLADKKKDQKQENRQKQEAIINIQNLINEFVTFFLAGSQTTLSFTRMMIYRLASSPEIMQKVREQFAREITSEQITLSQLKNLKYFQKVQKETLRMDSSIGAIFTRIATKDHYLGNLKIYKGMTVTIRLRATHYKQSEYRNPLIFDPQRWNQQNIQNDTFAYLPFSSGARNCIGKHLALLENKIFMIELLRAFKKIEIQKPIQNVRMTISTLYGPQKIQTILTKTDSENR